MIKIFHPKWEVDIWKAGNKWSVKCFNWTTLRSHHWLSIQVHYTPLHCFSNIFNHFGGSFCFSFPLFTVNLPETLTCGVNWRCDCAFKQKDCCCGARQFMALEDTIHTRLVALNKELYDVQMQTEAVTGTACRGGGGCSATILRKLNFKRINPTHHQLIKRMHVVRAYLVKATCAHLCPINVMHWTDIYIYI